MIESSTVPLLLWSLFYAYIGIEVAFYLIFRLYMVPRSNQWVEPQPYRDYGKDRCRILFRIVNRALRVAEAKDIDYKTAVTECILACFDPIPEDERTTTRVESQSLKSHLRNGQSSTAPVSQASVSTSVRSSSDDSNSDDSNSIESSSVDENINSETSSDSTWTVDGVGRTDMDHLMGWALFGKPLNRFEPWEHEEKQRCFDELEKQLGVVFAAGSGGVYKARCLSLDDTNPWHRPLVIYAMIYGIHLLACLVLLFSGYKRVVSKTTGLTGWYRPARDKASEALLPVLFWHGIAPGGLFFYLPIILAGIVNDGRASFLFENRNISSRIGFRVLTEVETIQGVKEIVDKYLAPDQALSLVGHSFGSVPLTWLMHATAFRHRIQQFVLLDPVTILLSEPDVMVNFLYKRSLTAIRLVAGSELFTEYYLRRHFNFCNSELWLEDIPDGIQPIVCLSEEDSVVNARNVRDYIKMCTPVSAPQDKDPVKLVFWEGVAHAACVASPAKWKEIKKAMQQQETVVVRQGIFTTRPVEVDSN